MSNCLWSHGPTRLLSPWDSPGKNTGVGCHVLLQGISQPRDQTQVSHASGGLLHWRWILYQLSQQPGSPFIFSYHCVRHNHFKIRVISQGRLSQTHVVLLIWQRENASSAISWKVLNDLTSLSLWLPLFYLHWRFQSSSNSLGTFLPPHPHIPYFIFLD